MDRVLDRIEGRESHSATALPDKQRESYGPDVSAFEALVLFFRSPTGQQRACGLENPISPGDLAVSFTVSTLENSTQVVIIKCFTIFASAKAGKTARFCVTFKPTLRYSKNNPAVSSLS